jgi:hypothetical protein
MATEQLQKENKQFDETVNLFYKKEANKPADVSGYFPSALPD